MCPPGQKWCIYFIAKYQTEPNLLLLLLLMLLLSFYAHADTYADKYSILLGTKILQKHEHFTSITDNII